MKVAIVSPMILPITSNCGGAVENLILNFINKNEENGKLKIDLFSTFFVQEKEYKNTRFKLIKVSNINIIKQKVLNLFLKLGFRKERYEIIIEKTIKELNKNKYDAIIVENRMGLYIKIAEKYKMKTNLYFHLHNDFEGNDKTPEKYLKIVKTAKKIFCVSKYIMNKLNSIEYSKNNIVINNSIDFTNFPQNYEYPKNIDNFKKNIIIGYFGRITSEKGVLELVRAFKIAFLNQKNIRLMIVGKSWFDSNKKTEYEQRLIDETKDIKDYIIFSGFVSPNIINNYYRACDIVVIPTLCEEAFGMVAIEAMYTNNLILVTDSGELPNLVKCNELVIKRDNNLVENLANKIIYFSENYKKIDYYKNKLYTNFIKCNIYTVNYYYNCMCKELEEE